MQTRPFSVCSASTVIAPKWQFTLSRVSAISPQTSSTFFLAERTARVVLMPTKYSECLYWVTTRSRATMFSPSCPSVSQTTIAEETKIAGGPTVPSTLQAMPFAKPSPASVTRAGAFSVATPGNMEWVDASAKLNTRPSSVKSAPFPEISKVVKPGAATGVKHCASSSVLCQHSTRCFPNFPINLPPRPPP